MLFTDSGSGRATALAAEVGGEAVATNEDLVKASDFVILAVKPASLEGVAASLPRPRAVLSLLGATTLAEAGLAVPGEHGDPTDAESRGRSEPGRHLHGRARRR